MRIARTCLRTGLLARTQALTILHSFTESGTARSGCRIVDKHP
jgi:hypothetical protein